MTGAGVGGVTSRLSVGIPDSSLDLGAGDTVTAGASSAAAKSTEIVIPIEANEVENVKRMSERNNNCRMFWRIARVLLESPS
jgi:hypothetical protein